MPNDLEILPNTEVLQCCIESGGDTEPTLPEEEDRGLAEEPDEPADLAPPASVPDQHYEENWSEDL